MLSSSGVALPAQLESTLRRCLEKKPAARYQSAGEVVAALSESGGEEELIALVEELDLLEGTEPEVTGLFESDNGLRESGNGEGG